MNADQVDAIRQCQAHDMLVQILDTGEDAVSRDIRWTKFSGGERSCGIGPYPASQDDKRKAELLAWAEECGWTPKRWWKYWRWSDSDPRK
jgi:hypothetical protein